MRADLHVHSRHSRSRHFRRAGMRDCYAAPSQVYDAAKRAGMDLVTITDRDTIEGCLRLLEERGEPPDFVVGEEVEASLPGSPLKVHVNVWGIDERRHAEIARLRADVADLARYLRSERIAHAFNHFVGSLPVDVPSAETYWRVLQLFDALEVRNGSQGRHYNALVAALAVGEAARRPPVGFVGGSDAHSLRRVGATWTEAEADGREAFLEAIRAGRTAVGGRILRPSDVVLDVAALARAHYAEVLGSLRGGNDGGRTRAREALKALAWLPIQTVGAPLAGAAVYFWRVRAQVRSLQREIAGLDLLTFRETMSAFPRRAAGAPEEGGRDEKPASGLPAPQGGG